MNRIIALILAVMLCAGLTACGGVSQSEYDKVVAERDALLEQQGASVESKSGDTAKDTPKEQKGLHDDIWEQVKPEVAASLKMPDSAEFDDISSASFYEIADGTYEVLADVRGKNALGSVVTNHFCATVNVDSNGNVLMVNDVQFLGDELFQERTKANEEITTRRKSGKTYLTAEELEREVLKQPVYIQEVKRIDDIGYSSDSMLQAMIYNNSDKPVKNVIVAFTAWDKNGLPVKIKKRISISDGSYFARCNYDGINLMPEDTYTGKDGNTFYGMEIDSSLDIVSMKAIVVSFEDFDGNAWENPNILDFKHLYEEKVFVE